MNLKQAFDLSVIPEGAPKVYAAPRVYNQRVLLWDKARVAAVCTPLCRLVYPYEEVVEWLESYANGNPKAVQNVFSGRDIETMMLREFLITGDPPVDPDIVASVRGLKKEDLCALLDDQDFSGDPADMVISMLHMGWLEVSEVIPQDAGA